MIYTGIKVRAPDVHLIVLRQLPVQLDSGIYVLNTVTETPYSTITLLAAYCHYSTTTPHRTIALTRGTMKVFKNKEKEVRVEFQQEEGGRGREGGERKEKEEKEERE
ncbi:hypothetical protein PoB_001072500 [Plakobranchus ocellatus]|uniref:Uncharacterized protein n=1 Tax=Plakobranchus ocellatus TaxID=259542 RepID=A0AAV3YP34_9GAST|nr:hypothetical protein PoB_001072500 [Plakobranchus ocellatus]